MFFTPYFSAVYNQERLILQTIYVLNKEIFQKNLQFIIKSVFKSRVGYNSASMVYYSIGIILWIVDVKKITFICLEKSSLIKKQLHNIHLHQTAVQIIRKVQWLPVLPHLVLQQDYTCFYSFDTIYLGRYFKFTYS